MSKRLPRPPRPKSPSNNLPRDLKAMAGTAPAIALALLLSGCGSNDNDPGPGGVTVGEARALDEAAEMLDEQRLPAKDSSAEAPEGATEESAPPR